MKNWKIWRSGYACTGQSDGPALLAEIKAETFDDAVAILAKTDSNIVMNDPNFNHKKDTHTWCGCSLHPTRKECWDPED